MLSAFEAHQMTVQYSISTLAPELDDLGDVISAAANSGYSFIIIAQGTTDAHDLAVMKGFTIEVVNIGGIDKWKVSW